MVLHAQTCYSTDRWSHTKIQIFLEINPVFPNFSIPHNAFTDAHRLLFTSKLITKLIHRGLAIWRNHQERMKKKTGKNTQIWSLSLSYHWFHLIISLILPCHLTDFTMRNQWDDSMKKVLWQRFLSFFQCQNCTKNSSKTAYKCSSLIIRQLQKHPKIRIFQGKSMVRFRKSLVWGRKIISLSNKILLPNFDELSWSCSAQDIEHSWLQITLPFREVGISRISYRVTPASWAAWNKPVKCH